MGCEGFLFGVLSSGIEGGEVGKGWSIHVTLCHALIWC